MIPNWAPMFSWWVHNGLIRKFNWRNDEIGKPSEKVAALMIYIAITMKCAEEVGIQEVKITYTRLSEMTGISRQLIREGTAILVKLDMIDVTRIGRNNTYKLISNKERSGWCKIPVRAITSEGGHAITPFEDLKLRRKVELHALKIFIYLASVRDNYTEYSLASYQTISSAVGITEKDIQRALALLSLVGLITRISSEKADDTKKNQPNRYYLAGYKSFVKRSDW